MKHHQGFTLYGIFLLFLCCFQYSIAQQDKEQLLLQNIGTFNQAFKKGDADQLAAMITDTYLHTNGTSAPIDKETWVAYLRKRQKEITSGTLVVHSYEMTEQHYEWYNDMAIVSGKVNVSRTKNGKHSEHEFRVTHIWVYQNNSWKRAGFHDGKIK